jgi:hypothetical protein
MDNKKDQNTEEKAKRVEATRKYNNSAKGKATRARYLNSPRGRETIARQKRRASAKETPEQYANRIICSVKARDSYFASIDESYTDRLW